jgi:hypothetical protein
MNDLNALDLDQAVKIISGSARSMGIEVKEWWNLSDLKNYLIKQKI